MKYLFVVLLAVLCAGFADGSVYYEPTDNWTLLNCVNESTLAVEGTVSTMTGFYQPDIQGGIITTEVLIRVINTIKGTPNFGNNHVKFHIYGGTAYVPNRDEVMIMRDTGQPKFEVGEKVLVFLTTADDGDYYPDNFPLNRLHVIKGSYGKFKVKDSKVQFKYVKDARSLVDVKFPLDLATELGKASLVDKTAAEALEHQIKALARNAPQNFSLSKALSSNLKNQAKTIITNAEKK